MKWQEGLKKITSISKTNRLIVCGVAGILLIGLSTLIGSGGKQQESAETSSGVTTEEYAVQLEHRLEKMIKGIQGVGTCRVLITMEQGAEYIYATQDKNSTEVDETSESDKLSTESKSSGEQTYIMVSTKQGEQPLLLTELAPRVKGVVAVCDGGGNPQVVQTVIQALSTALDIREDQICVVAKA